LQIERPRFIPAIQKHKCVGAVHIERRRMRDRGEGAVCGIKRFRELSLQEKIGQPSRLCC
jgi:hypothetical protein